MFLRFYGVDQSFPRFGIPEDVPLPGGGSAKLKNVDKRSPRLKKGGVRFHPIVHVVRHPLTHIEATSRCICAKGIRTDSERSGAWDAISWAYANNFVNLCGQASGQAPGQASLAARSSAASGAELLRACATAGEARSGASGGATLGGVSVLERSARYWLLWNEHVEGLGSRAATLRIEDLSPRALVAALDLPRSAVAFNASRLGGGQGGLAGVPEALAIHAAAYAGSSDGGHDGGGGGGGGHGGDLASSGPGALRGVLTWAGLSEAVGSELTSRIMTAAARYGYSTTTAGVAASKGHGQGSSSFADFKDGTRGARARHHRLETPK